MDRIISALKDAPGGLTKTEIHRVFRNHKSKGDIDGALLYLLEYGVIRKEDIKTSGRTSQRYYWIEK